MYSVPGDTTSLVPGFPIRTSSDPRSVGSSPRHIAASHVLHRLLVPRHPPCALKHLQHKKPIEKNCTSTPKTPTPHQRGTRILRARCSQPLSTNQTPHPTTKAGRQQTIPTRKRETAGLVASKPNSVSGSHRRPTRPNGNVCCAPEPAPLQRTAHPTNRLSHRTPTRCGRAQVSWCSLERR